MFLSAPESLAPHLPAAGEPAIIFNPDTASLHLILQISEGDRALSLPIVYDTKANTTAAWEKENAAETKQASLNTSMLLAMISQETDNLSRPGRILSDLMLEADPTLSKCTLFWAVRRLLTYNIDELLP